MLFSQPTSAVQLYLHSPFTLMTRSAEAFAVEQNLTEPIIRCMPEGICSWRYRLEGAEHAARLAFNNLGEQGTIQIADLQFDVVKHGMFSGSWTLDHEGRELASATKTSAFTRHFKVEDPNGTYDLRPESTLGRGFKLEQAERVVALFRPDHAFTRRATISPVSHPWDLPTLCFSFWLVVLTWIRAAQSS